MKDDGRHTAIRQETKILAVSLAALALLGGCKTPADQPAEGRKIAEQWCSECHRVEPDQPSGARPGHVLPSPMPGPSFMDIAARPGVDSPWLHRFTDELHLPMPIYRLPPDQREAVIAYILSLKALPATGSGS